MESFLMEAKNLKLIGAPVDLNTAAVVGERISMKTGDRLAIILLLSASTSATLQVTLKQHNAASAGTSKVLEVMNPYYIKAGVATSFTKVEPTVAASMFDISTQFAADSGIAVFEVLAEDLDVNNNFTHVSVELADSAAAKIGAGLYVVGNTRFKPAYNQAV